MSDRWAEVVGGVAVRCVVATQDPTPILPTAGEWVDVTGINAGKGWSYSVGAWTGPNGQPAVAIPQKVEIRYLLTGAEWVARFTSSEWAWLKSRRNDGTAAGEQLDQMMDSIRWLDAVNVQSPYLDQFYNWLVAQGIPGGQTRVDELRSGV